MIRVVLVLALMLNFVRPTSSGSASCSVSLRPEVIVDGLRVSFPEAAIFVMPGRAVELEVASVEPAATTLHSDAGDIRLARAGYWRWQAPDMTGLYHVWMQDASGAEMTRLNAFVMAPASRVTGGALNGYRIGQYPARPLKGNPLYLAPDGFIEVTRANEHTKVSPHFRIKQFLCKQAGGYPKYAALDPRLLVKLEAIVGRLGGLGFSGEDIHVMSGFRTPSYNEAIGNVQYSLHQWGRAADIFLDHDGDGRMDDLNRDRRVDAADSTALAQIVASMNDQAALRPLVGGLGTYGSTDAHGPFVHVDVRGWAAHW